MTRVHFYHGAQDRVEAAAKGCPPPKIYVIGQNDKYDAHCKCAKCQAIVRREGSESGPLIEFVNAVGEAIEIAYPDILIGTYAYNLTQPPPKTIRPRQTSSAISSRIRASTPKPAAVTLIAPSGSRS